MEKAFLAWWSPLAIRSLVDRAVAGGRWERDPQGRLTLSPTEPVALGKDADGTWPDLVRRRIPAMILGQDPDDEQVRRRLSRSDGLQAAIVAVAYGLPASVVLHPEQVRSELIWRFLREGMPDQLGTGPFPMITDPGPVGAVVLGRLAESSGTQIGELTARLAARVLGAPDTDAATLRRSLLKQGAQRGAVLLEFAARVRAAAPEPRVPIAQVYERYCQVEPAIDLPAFKERLVAAAQRRLLSLGALTLPEGLSPELRERSATAWGADRVHFVVLDGVPA